MDTSTWNIPFSNTRHELYCQRRVEGMTQRQAMLSAWPDRTRWKSETVDKRACELEADGKVKGRIATLKRAAAEKATTTRAEVLEGMSETFEAGVRRVRGAGEGWPLIRIPASATKMARLPPGSRQDETLGSCRRDALPPAEHPRVGDPEEHREEHVSRAGVLDDQRLVGGGP